MNRLEALGLVIRETRQAKGLSQEKLAELSKLHRNFIGLVERSATVPALDSLFAIADALGCEASELMTKAEQLADS